MTSKAEIERTPESKAKKSRIWIYIFAAIVIITVIAWILIRPGVYTIQPIGALPEGVTIIYHSRNPEMAFFSSPDGLCLKLQGSVSLLCRLAAVSASADLTDRIIFRLPYMRWAYLLSTGGKEFEK
jgi:hypothetical protein